MPPYPHITSQCFVNAPFGRLETDLLELFVDNRIQPEVGLEGDFLYTHSHKDFRRIADIFKKENLQCTLHAPFFDLAPGAVDPKIRQASRDKLRRAFELIEIFEPVSIVCHLGYEENKHGFKKNEWCDIALETWQQMLNVAESFQTPMMLENTYETIPEMHGKVLAALDSPYARFCLDAGHTMAFAGSSWENWLPELAPWLGQLHLHDNMGDSDVHLAVGQGVFDFAGLFFYLQKNGLTPIVTLEPHQEEGLWQSLEALDKMQYFDGNSNYLENQ